MGMKKIFSILIVVCLVFWGIGCEEKSNLENEIKPQENAIPNFGVTYQEIITSLGENDYNYKEVSQYDFENNEANTLGVIYINPDDEYDIIRTQIRHSYQNVFQVYITYTIDNNSPENTANLLVDLYELVLEKIKPDKPKDFLKNLTSYSNGYYSQDLDNLRVTITYEDEGLEGIAVEAMFVYLDFVPEK